MNKDRYMPHNTEFKTASYMIDLMFSFNVIPIRSPKFVRGILGIRNKYIRFKRFIFINHYKYVYNVYTSSFSGLGLFPDSGFKRLSRLLGDSPEWNSVAECRERWGNWIPRLELFKLLHMDANDLRERLTPSRLLASGLGADCAFINGLNSQCLCGVFGSGAKISYRQYYCLSKIGERFDGNFFQHSDDLWHLKATNFNQLELPNHSGNSPF